MGQLLEFVRNHLILVSAFAAVLTWLIVSEVMRATRGVKSLEPGMATHLYNRQDALFVDIRGDAEFLDSHLPGAVHLPPKSVGDAAKKLKAKPQQPLIVYCNAGNTSGRAAAQLRAAGFANVYELKGGFGAWRSAGYPLEGKKAG